MIVNRKNGEWPIAGETVLLYYRNLAREDFAWHPDVAVFEDRGDDHCFKTRWGDIFVETRPQVRFEVEWRELEFPKCAE